jgi:FtsH-binding integral membrane protein
MPLTRRMSKLEASLTHGSKAMAKNAETAADSAGRDSLRVVPCVAGASTLETTMKTNNIAYRSAVGLALAAALLLVWLSLAVGINGPDGEPFDRIYIGVLAIGIIGAVIARLQPGGIARALFATALAQASVAVIALIAGKHQSGVSPVPEILGVNGIFVALFLGSAWLFRKAAREQTPAGAAP